MAIKYIPEIPGPDASESEREEYDLHLEYQAKYWASVKGNFLESSFHEERDENYEDDSWIEDAAKDFLSDGDYDEDESIDEIRDRLGL